VFQAAGRTNASAPLGEDGDHGSFVDQVHVFDLATDTNAPLCVQKVVRKAHLTRLAFNPTQPVLVVGDDRHVPDTRPASRSGGAVCCGSQQRRCSCMCALRPTQASGKHSASCALSGAYVCAHNSISPLRRKLDHGVRAKVKWAFARDRGGVTMLRLSPNLRKPLQPGFGQTAAEAATAQLQQVMDMALTSALASGGDDAAALSDSSL